MIVPIGHVGVVLRGGAFTDRVLEPGTHWLWPLTDSVVMISTQEKLYEVVEENLVSKVDADFSDHPLDATSCFRLHGFPSRVRKPRVVPRGLASIWCVTGRSHFASAGTFWRKLATFSHAPKRGGDFPNLPALPRGAGLGEHQSGQGRRVRRGRPRRRQMISCTA